MDVYLVGIGMTKFGPLPDKSVKDITGNAVNAALSDAGIGIGEIESSYFANATQGALEGQYMIPGQVALRSIGLQGVPVVNVEIACASASTAFSLACKDIRSGDSSVALAVGAEKMITPDKAKNMAVFDGAIDVNGRDETLDGLMALSDGFELPPEATAETGMRSVFMDVYAAIAKHHMKLHGTTQRQMAAVAAKNHDHSVHNERAQFRKSFTVDEVLEARKISWPLTLPMCSPISDGGAAAILCSEDALDRFDKSRAVKDRGLSDCNRQRTRSRRQQLARHPYRGGTRLRESRCWAERHVRERSPRCLRHRRDHADREPRVLRDRRRGRTRRERCHDDRRTNPCEPIGGP